MGVTCFNPRVGRQPCLTSFVPMRRSGSPSISEDGFCASRSVATSQATVTGPTAPSAGRKHWVGSRFWIGRYCQRIHVIDRTNLGTGKALQSRPMVTEQRVVEGAEHCLET